MQSLYNCGKKKERKKERKREEEEVNKIGTVRKSKLIMKNILWLVTSR